MLDRYLHPHLGDVVVGDVNAAILDATYVALRHRGGIGGRPLSAGTLTRIHSVVRAAFSQAMRWEWITRDPTKLVRRPAKINVRPDVPTPAQLAQVVAAAERSNRPEMARFLWVGAITGARSSELRAVRITDVDLDAGWLGVERALSAEQVWTTKNRRIRDVGLDEVTVQVIRAQVAFMEWTPDGRLRHPSFLGLRVDKAAREVVRGER